MKIFIIAVLCAAAAVAEADYGMDPMVRDAIDWVERFVPEVKEVRTNGNYMEILAKVIDAMQRFPGLRDQMQRDNPLLFKILLG
ncbi:hypothetical protein BOX15_Mlig024277g4 [Macrostomum lignano]|uniref:Uncharacterized protein n=1 Tax=Macrostomum lignano TaxID=282301 RepID=A0A267EDY4_9PLAT|nr:hypothetical protein BOX15_Mlig024277g2 [Macrostomum lignano]PAA59781.1 hypothetical protein BOX15_Mlig024277g1 [Macrostomum lignano]PAA76573.1 hypothetical protein BOX15_Mlig024277g4 [Macrostomum lignano]